MATRYKIGRPTLALLAVVLGGVVVPATAVAAQRTSLPTACVDMEALVGNQAGPTPGGEVIRVNSTTQSVLSSDTAPAGGPDLVDPEDLAYLSNGDLVVADPGGSTGAPRIVEVNPHTGGRTLVSGRTSATGPTTGTGPDLVYPDAVAVEATGDILVGDRNPTTRMPRLLRINPVTGDRTILSGASAGGTSLAVGPMPIGVVNGVIYITNAARLMSVDPVTGWRTLISGWGLRGGGPTFSWSTYSITGSSITDTVMLLDGGYLNGSGPYLGALFTVDVVTGTRTLFSDNTTPPGSTQFYVVRDMAYDSCADTYYVVDDEDWIYAPPRIITVDGASATKPGKRTLYSTFVGTQDFTIQLAPMLYLPGGGSGGGGTTEPPPPGNG